MEGKKKKDSEKEEFPGYPHYPAKEDIMSGNSGMERIQSDIEGPPRNEKPAVTEESTRENDPAQGGVNEPVEGRSPNDITQDDLMALGDENLAQDGGDDEDLQQRIHGVDMAASDLDVPGSEDDDKNEEIGSEDEENNFYSLGGDRHEK